jgi:hypothetical protein
MNITFLFFKSAVAYIVIWIKQIDFVKKKWAIEIVGEKE